MKLMLPSALLFLLITICPVAAQELIGLDMAEQTIKQLQIDPLQALDVLKLSKGSAKITIYQDAETDGKPCLKIEIPKGTAAEFAFAKKRPLQGVVKQISIFAGGKGRYEFILRDAWSLDFRLDWGTLPDSESGMRNMTQSIPFQVLHFYRDYEFKGIELIGLKLTAPLAEPGVFLIQNLQFVTDIAQDSHDPDAMPSNW